MKVKPYLVVAAGLALLMAAASTPYGRQVVFYIVQLQQSTPGTKQTGHINISGTMIAGTYQGDGSSLAGVNAAQLGGHSASAFALLGGTQTFTGADTFTGGLSTNAFQLTASPQAGFVMTSDGSGNGSWKTPSITPTGPAGGDLAGTYPNPTFGFLPSSLAKVSGGAMFTDGAFVGIGTSLAIGSAGFVFSQNTGGYGGMYVNTSGAAGLPFYGYAQSGAAVAYTYVDGSDGNKWKLFDGGIRVTVAPGGQVGIGTTAPKTVLDVEGDDAGASVGTFVQASGSGAGSAVYGKALVANAAGVVGEQMTGPQGAGGAFRSYAGNGGYGVIGRTFSSSNGIGVYGEASGAGSYAVYSQGNLGCFGTKQFVIDDPLDPENKLLLHYCSEGPEPLNVYSGNVVTDGRGYATVSLPAYFQEINRDFRYQLTVIDDGGRADFVQVKVVSKIQGNQFRIRTSAPNVEVSWEVKGVRNDRWVRKYGAPVETDKPDYQRGKYANPELYGRPPEEGMHYRGPMQGSQVPPPSGGSRSRTKGNR